MGLPCAHEIKSLKGEVLYLHDIHPQWRLDIRSLEKSEAIQSSDKDKVQEMLKEFQQKYNGWSLDKKKKAREQIFELVNEPSLLLNEPRI